MPGSDTPFGGAPIHGLANLLFSVRKIFLWRRAHSGGLGGCSPCGPSTGESNLFFGRLRSSGLDQRRAARIRASRTEIPRGLGHIRMGFVLCPWAQNGHDGFVYALVILSLVGLLVLLLLANSQRANDVLLISTCTTGPTGRKVGELKNGKNGEPHCEAGYESCWRARPDYCGRVGSAARSTRVDHKEGRRRWRLTVVLTKLAVPLISGGMRRGSIPTRP